MSDKRSGSGGASAVLRRFLGTILRIGFPDENEVELERRVDLKVRRHELLSKPEAPTLRAILDETVLRRPVGGPAVMRNQIDRLPDALALPKDGLQVIRSSAGPHPGAFHCFRFGFSELPDVVYTESLTGSACVDQREEVVTCLEVPDRMSVQAAPVHKELRKEF